MVTRLDHFSDQREKPQEVTPKVINPTEEVPSGTPQVLVTPDLIEMVEAAFCQAPTQRFVTTMDDAVSSVTWAARRVGQNDVINYLRSLVKDPTQETS